MSLLSFACRHRYSSGFELDVQFETDQRVTTLFGASGSGKTSVLSMIAGFVTPNHGTIIQDQRTLTDIARGINLRPERRRIGFVFQDHLLFPHLSVEANLRYGERRQQRAAVAGDFSHVVNVLELGALLKRSPAHLSGGERQRVGLGRALLSRPELLLLDEPWAALDEALRNRILVYIERVVHEWDIPILFVSHDQGSVRRLAEWVVIVAQGRVVATGRDESGLKAVKEMGATSLIDLKRPDSEISEAYAREAGDGYDIILDFLWGRPTELLFRTITPSEVGFAKRRTRYVQIGQAAGASITFLAEALRTSGLELAGVGKVPPGVLPQSLEQVWRWVLEGKLSMDVEKVELSSVAEAWQRKTRGKRIVIVP